MSTLLEENTLETIWNLRKAEYEKQLKSFPTFRELLTNLDSSESMRILSRVQRAKQSSPGSPLILNLDSLTNQSNELQEHFTPALESHFRPSSLDFKQRMCFSEKFDRESIEAIVKRLSWRKSPGTNGIEYAHFKCSKIWTLCLVHLFKLYILFGYPSCYYNSSI